MHIFNLSFDKIYNLPLTSVVISLLIFLVFLILRKLFTKIIVKAANVFVAKTKTKLDDKVIEIIIEPVRFAFIVLGAYISISYAEINNKMTNDIFNSLSVFIIFWILFKSIFAFENNIKIFSKKFGSELHEEIGLFLIKSIKIIIIIIGLGSVLEVWNINISAFIASLGLGGLAFALAAKDTAANLVGGLTMLADKSLKMQDWIKVGSVEGVVEEIGLRTTKIRTFEKSLITVPNQILATNPVENFSRRGIRRIKFRVGLTYSTKSSQIESIVAEIKTMLLNHKDIAQTATMLVRFDTFEDSSLSIFIYTFTATSNWARYLEIKEDVNFKVMKIVEQNESEFAFPSQTIYINKKEEDV
jgi:MscS family membrane protein